MSPREVAAGSQRQLSPHLCPQEHRMAQSGDGARPPSSGSPCSSPQLSYERVRLKERLQGPGSGAEGAVWRVSAHCEDRGMEEQGKVGIEGAGPV